MARTIGIDLGTTNSVVAFYEGQRVESIPNSEGSRLTPSCVYYKSDQEIIVGELAKRQYLVQPGRCVRSVKRIMGKRYNEIGMSEEALPFEVCELEDGMAGVVLEGEVRVRPEEISADILDRLQEIAEDYLGEQINQAVITVPAHFNDQQRTATKAAAEMAGLEVLRIINEPTAAALAFGFGGDRSGTVAVFDFGGGTFDVSLLEISGDIFEVLSTNGDNHLGGDDIDQILFDHVCYGVLEKTGIDPRVEVLAAQRIREAVERAKCELSTLKSTTIALPFIVADAEGPKHYEQELTRDAFNRMMEPLFLRLFGPCRTALADANIALNQIDHVLLVGGSTRIPRVQQLVAEFFDRSVSHGINPDEAVALGAAIQSGVITGALREVLLIDVTPLTLGIELAGGVFKPLIPRNSTIPCEASDKFTTVVDNQTAVVVHALQGERRQASENHSLAKFRLVGIPPAPKELAEIQVKFGIDANGILSVTAMDLSTGKQTGIVVENYGDIGTRREIVEKIVQSAVEHTKEDEDFVRFAARRQRAERLQSRANKLIQVLGNMISDEHMRMLKESMLRLDLSMEKRDERTMVQHEEVLDEIITNYEQNPEAARTLARQLTSQIEEMDFDSKILDPHLGADVPTLDESTAYRKGRSIQEVSARPPAPASTSTPVPMHIEEPPAPKPEPKPAGTMPRGPWAPAPKSARGPWIPAGGPRVHVEPEVPADMQASESQSENAPDSDDSAPMHGP